MLIVVWKIMKKAQYFEKSKNLDPDYAWTYFELGWNLQRIEKNEEALNALKKAVELDSENTFALAEIGRYI